MKIFERRVPFYKAMQRIEARKWQSNKESFDQYALTKLALMQGLDLPIRDVIYLLIGGIISGPLRAMAFSLSVEDFLDRMRNIAETPTESERKTLSSRNMNRAKIKFV